MTKNNLSQNEVSGMAEIIECLVAQIELACKENRFPKIRERLCQSEEGRNNANQKKNTD